MAGSIYGKLFSVSTWGESHGEGLGVVIDGCPSGVPLSEEDIQRYLDRRKPGQNRYATPRKEGDQAKILSGVFEGRTTGTPISICVMNTSQRSADYREIAQFYRPGHADYSLDCKYGFRDYRGGGRSSGRETIGRVAAGAVAMKILESLGVQVRAYTRAIGPVSISQENIDITVAKESPLQMPDKKASLQAEKYLAGLMKEGDSAGGLIECVVDGMMPGIGETVFDKLDASLAKGIFSIGAVKGVEIGEGFGVCTSTGSQNNDAFYLKPSGAVGKKTNFSGGILGGISDGSQIVIRAAIKPTPSITKEQDTVNRQNETIQVSIKGRHDPVIVPRAVVVVEAMTAITLVDEIFVGMSSRMDRIVEYYRK